MAGAASRITVEIGGRIAASLTKSLRDAQRQVSTLGQNINRSMAAASRGFKGTFRDDAFQAAATAAAGIGLALNNSVKAAAAFQGVLTDIGKTSGASNAELKELGAQLRGLSIRNRTNLAPNVLAEGVQDLVAQGLDLKDAVASIEALGRVATATGSQLTDVTKTGFQLQNALKIQPTELKATFDALAFAGKQGAFELKDMAQFMPTIAAAAGSLGIQGRKGAVSLAAMMQMVRKDAPDAGQAATRLTDAMLKMTAPQTVKNFEKFGVNIEQVLKDAQKNGINPMEAALDTLFKVTGGDSFKLGEIFGDKEAKLALMSLMKYREEYEKLRDDAGGSAAAGTVDQDYLRSIDTFQGRLTTFQNSMQNLGIVVGNALMPPLAALADFLTPIFENIGRLADQFPTLTGVVVGLAAAFVGLVAVAPFIASLMSVASGLGITLGGIAAVATGPIGLTIAAIVGIGTALVIAYDKVAWFRSAVNAAWAAIKQAFAGFVTYLGGAWKVFTGLFTGDVGRMKEGFSQALSGLGMMFSAWTGWLGTVWNGVTSTIQSAFQGAVAGVQAIWQGLVSFFQGLVAQIGTVFQGVGAAVMAVMFPLPTLILGVFGQLPPGVQGVFNQVVAVIRAVPGQLADVGGAIIQTIINGIKAKAAEMYATVKGVFAEVRKLMPFSDAKEGPFQHLTKSGKAIVTTLAGGVGAAAPRLSEALHDAASGAMRALGGPDGAMPGLALAGAGGQGLTAAGVPVQSQPVVPNYGGLDVPAPGPAAMYGGASMGMTMNPTVNVNVTSANATADDIADKVMRVFNDMLGEAEASVRAFLND